MSSTTTRAGGIEPRRAALTVLQELRNGKPLESALQRGLDTLPDADRRLAHQLAAGVLRQRTVIDQRLSPLVERGWRKVSPALQDILRLGAFQLIALDRVPSHAAVDTSVALARDIGGSKAGGFVNAVLRRLASEDSTAPTPVSTAAPLAQRYSHPEWLVQRWLAAFGSASTERLLEWNNTKSRLVLQPARAELSELAERWGEAGIAVESAPHGAGLLTDQSRPAQLPGYRDGSFIVQDPAQALLAQFASFPRGATIYDACAAPGGKTIALGRSSATVLAGEVSRSRAHRLAENLERAGSGREHVVVADARMPPLRSVGSVLLDAPCLGTGTFARHPDARWRVRPEALTTLQRLQSELLEALSGIVEPGGLLVYSTCSLEPEENDVQIDHFLERHPEFSRESASRMSPSLLSEKGDLVLLPHLHGVDGAYAARLRRTA